MYLEIPQGRKINIQGLECNLPPEGYVYNNLTKQLEHIGVYQRSPKKEEQYWERFALPSWYREVTKREDEYLKRRKEGDAPFYDERYEAFKRQEWSRRLNGFWFMNNGTPVYLTGFYYMLLQWFNIDIGVAKFIMPHLTKTYFLEYCINDPMCMGMIDVTKRRFLKTFMGGLFVLEYVTRTKMVNGAIQSKTGNDAKKVFGKAVVYPFRKFPRFFRPEYDMSLGINPKTEIRFQQTNIRGKKAEDTIDKDELGSMIDWGSADHIHYDGQKVHRYFSDEWAKTTEANVFDRHEVIRYCLLDEEGKIIGKALYSSTVEKLDSDKDGVQEAARQLWDASDQNNKKENGMTESGLYRFFQTSDEGRNFDIYGYPDIEKTISDIIADRRSVEDNPRSLNARKKKEPRTIEEAFSADGDKCLFNVEKLIARQSLLGYHRELTEKGNFMWKDGIRDSEVVWMPNVNGKWEVVKEFIDDFLKDKQKFVNGQNVKYNDSNATFKRGGLFIPVNDHRFGGATDPYDHDTVDDNRRSMAGSLIKQKTNLDNYDDKFNWCDVCKYIARPATAELMYEDILMQHFFFSCRMLPETQKPGIMRYFRNRGYAAFLMILPGYTEPGIPSTPENKQVGCEFTEYDVEMRIDKYYFIDVIDDLLNLDIKKTQKYDLGMAKIWTEVACLNKMYEKPANSNVVDVSNLFKQYRVKSA